MFIPILTKLSTYPSPKDNALEMVFLLLIIVLAASMLIGTYLLIRFLIQKINKL